MAGKVIFEYNKELKTLSVCVDYGVCAAISIRDLEPMERLLKMLKIPFEAYVGEMMGDTDYLLYQYNNDLLYQLGVEAGRKQMMDHIQHQCANDKPVEANGELYWIADSRQHLIGVMDDTGNAWDGEHVEKRYIVPIRMFYDDSTVVRELLVKADKALTAMLIARDFEHNGWVVDEDCENYKQLKIQPERKGGSMDNDIFEILTENALNERMDGILLQDEEYQEAQEKIDRLTEEVDKLGLTKEQRIIIDRLIVSHTENGCCYGRLAYQQGFKDCASLLREMGLIE